MRDSILRTVWHLLVASITAFAKGYAAYWLFDVEVAALERYTRLLARRFRHLFLLLLRGEAT